ncbi:MAG: 2Fe-2S iron-sulfur cluster binding domain-containing protein [Gammaproteobacteria bacterium]|nr:2Fe-2S iron-sulfur cluster binding domain-containing protein [Gammaproteobacteria bacterium]
MKKLIGDAALGKTPLQYTLLHSLPSPHGCQSGCCGMCKYRLIHGDVQQVIQNTAAELVDRVIFACCNIPTSYVQIELCAITETLDGNR